MRHRGRIEAAIQKVLILLLSCTSYNPVNPDELVWTATSCTPLQTFF